MFHTDSTAVFLYPDRASLCCSDAFDLFAEMESTSPLQLCAFFFHSSLLWVDQLLFHRPLLLDRCIALQTVALLYNTGP
jgi:hypothetical protein